MVSLYYTAYLKYNKVIFVSAYFDYLKQEEFLEDSIVTSEVIKEFKEQFENQHLLIISY